MKLTRRLCCVQIACLCLSVQVASAQYSVGIPAQQPTYVSDFKQDAAGQDYVDPRVSQMRLRIAQLQQAGKFSEAVRDLEKEIATLEFMGLRQESTALYVDLTALNRAKGHYEEAKKAFERGGKAAALNPDDQPVVQLDLGYALRLAGQYDKALPVLLTAQGHLKSDDPLYASLMQNLGLVYAGLGKDVDAETALKQAIDLENASAEKAPNQLLDSMIGLAQLYARQKRTDDLKGILASANAISQTIADKDNPRVKKLEFLQAQLASAKATPDKSKQ